MLHRSRQDSINAPLVNTRTVSRPRGATIDDNVTREVRQRVADEKSIAFNEFANDKSLRRATFGQSIDVSRNV